MQFIKGIFFVSSLYVSRPTDDIKTLNTRLLKGQSEHVNCVVWKIGHVAEDESFPLVLDNKIANTIYNYRI